MLRRPDGNVELRYILRSVDRGRGDGGRVAGRVLEPRGILSRRRPELRGKMAGYRHFAAVGSRPSLAEVASRAGVELREVREIFGRLRSQRVLVLEADGESIRMAPPFSGVPTQHRVTAGGVSYYANCAWDALGI